MEEAQQIDRTVIHPQLGPGKLLKTYMGGYEWEILFDSGRRFRLPARDGAIGHQRHAALARRRDHLRLIEKRMALDLIADQLIACQPSRLRNQRNRKVRHTDVARQPLFLDLTERPDRVRQGNPRIGPMQQEQIDFGQFQSLKGLLGGAVKVTSFAVSSMV